METEARMLSYLSKNDDVSQRKIAAHMHLSLGQTNIILHSLVRRGLLKIVKLNSRNVRYIITPTGIARNALRTYNSVLSAVKQVNTLTSGIAPIVRNYEDKGYRVFLDNERDEVFNILSIVIRDRKINSVKVYDAMDFQDEDDVVIVWKPERQKYFQDLGFSFVNILDFVEASN